MPDPLPIGTATIRNVRVFDGTTVGAPSEVHIVDGVITERAAPGSTAFDGGSAILLPGLIDAHAHVDRREQLDAMVAAGITTVLDMGAPDTAVLDGLRALPGLPQVRSSLAPASASGAFPTTHMGYAPSSAVTGPEDAERFVADRIAEGADHIKIIVEDPRIPPFAALDTGTVRAVAQAARDHGLLSVAHATSLTAVTTAVDGGVDVLTHVPIDRPIDPALADRIAAAGIRVVPTLIMMRGVAENVARARPGAVSYDHARSSVESLHAAGATIGAGTDANAGPDSINAVAHGTSLHDELDLLVDAGLTPVEALGAATDVPAAIFGLVDRGAIRPGLRADLVVVDADPTKNVSAARQVRQVWIAGKRVGDGR
ncbi:amidohydrolase family protein [uncultured Amnibacterium sp.]|uniref:amidohydrolase family protein n=1 Tax=uncultured Amnibacterium sp. TaxID=1631851 RepID=UPI0035CC5888